MLVEVWFWLRPRLCDATLRNGTILYDGEADWEALKNKTCSAKNCAETHCRFSCSKCDSAYCWDHVGMHFTKGEFIPKGFGTGLYKGYCAVVEGV